ncbi:alkaline phosphatase family protein [Ammoniphilus sp. 3BR4]|uniref:alkaline phosphatase family protein n=1 Tax=Ammoniphilus sp. 3BR4 TaxID=3158265 RepID=UPI003467BE64
MERNVILICIDGLAAYYLDDPCCRMPNLMELADRGTRAKSMKVAYPSSTWAMNTSIVTGVYPKKHGVLGNWVVNRAERKVVEIFGDRHVEKETRVHVPTVYDLAHKKGARTAAICWPVTRGAKHLDFNIPEFYEQELFESHCTPSFWNELKEQGFPVEQYGAWSKDHSRGHMQDWLTAEIAKHLIRTHQPNFMMLHFLLADSLQHDYGTHSPEAYWAMNYIDERIGEIRKAVQEQGMEEQTDWFIVSDHGFRDAHSVLSPNVLFKQRGWFDEEDPSKSQVMAVSNGGSGYVYVFDQELKDQVKEELLATGVVERVFEREDFASLGLPNHEHPHLPDLIIEAKEGYFIYFGAEGDQVIGTHKYKGMHGYLPDKEELKAIFVASGPDIIPGMELPEMDIVDIAPTIAEILNLELTETDGKVLKTMIQGKEVRA